MIVPFCNITVDTTRGLTDKKVKAGTFVHVLAERRDADGVKLLVRVGEYGRPFQVDASCTDYFLGGAR